MPKKQKQPLIGAHVAAAGGLYHAIENAKAIGAEAIQIFGASPRQWYAKVPSDADVRKYAELLKESGVGAVYLHGAYLVNLASPDEGLRAKSIKNMTEHLKIAARIEADGLIFHVGSGKDMPKTEAIKKILSGMKAILKAVPGKVMLVMENTAGGGQKIGSNPLEYGEIMSVLDSNRVKVCIDTAHSFEAGLIEEYTSPNIKRFLDEWDREVGLENVVALHVNDSKTVFNSHHDRHENIGEGYIGLQGFKNLAKEKRLNHTAWLLEVPGFDNEGPDKKNVDILKACFK